MKNDNSEFPQSKRYYKKWQTANLFGVLLFVVVLGIVGVVAIVLPKPTVSEEEKRELAKMPKFTIENYVKGSYTNDMDAFYSDTFPARSTFVRLGALIKSARGVKYDDITIHDVAPDIATETPDINDGQGVANTDGNIPPNNAQTEVETAGERVGSMYVYKNAAMEPFTYNNNAGKYYADVINQYKRELGDTVQIYNLIIPTAAEYNLPDKYKSANSSQRESMQFIYSNLADGIIGVDAMANLEKHKDEYLFFRSDHHWTVNGAYYAYEAFAKAAGFEPVKLSELQKKTLPQFLGTLYASTQNEGIKKNPDFVDYYLPKVQYTCTATMRNQPYSLYDFDLFAEYAKGSASYSVFLQGDHPMIHINTSNKNGRSIVMVKESFGNAFAPFLVNNYEDVYVIDQRYFQTSLTDFIRQNEIDELLFINNAFAANTTIRINEISRIMNQVYVPPVIEPEEPEDEDEEIIDEEAEQTTDDTKPNENEDIENNLSPEEERNKRKNRKDDDVEETPQERRKRLTGGIKED